MGAACPHQLSSAPVIASARSVREGDLRIVQAENNVDVDVDVDV